MSSETPSAGPDGSFRLGEWLVRPELNRITREEQTLQIEPRVMDVLVCLASRAGRVVSRHELREAVWSGTVVSDQTMTRAIWELRNALEDDHESPRIIETIRKGGYRLIAPVEYQKPAAFPVPLTAAESGDSGSWRGVLRGTPFFWPLAAAGLILAGAIFWLTISSRSDRTAPALLEARPLTTYPGRERFPAISPDGTRVAFSWKDEDGESYSIYVKQVNADSRLRLTDSALDDLYPTWSPDGSSVAFLRRSNPHTLFVVPAIGGPAREITQLGWGIHGLDWSPDGEWIAFTSYEAESPPSGIQLVSPETGESRSVTDPPPQSAYYSWPRFSPDGSIIAFIRSSNFVQKDVYIVAASGGEPHRLTRLLCPMAGMDWTADGSQLILSASQGQDHFLWLVSADDGKATLLPTPIIPASHPSLSNDTNSLVYESQSVDRDIWRLQIGEDGNASAAATPFVGSTRVDCCAEFSPDGSRVLFLSTRSGHKEVWICDRDGSDATRLTSLESLSMRQPRWSPDGTQIAFSAFMGEHARAFVMEVESGRTRCLSTRPRHEIVDAWSRDGNSLHLHCDSDSTWTAERMPVDDTEPTPLGIDGQPVVFETTSGEVLFLKYGKPGIWKARPRSRDGAPDDSERDHAVCEAQCIVKPTHMGGWMDVTFVDEGIYFVRRSAEGEVLGFFDYSTSAADTLAQLEGFGNAFLTVSPDRKTVLFDRPERDEIDLILVPRL